MKKVCEVSILLLFILVPNNKASAQAKVSESVRFLRSEEIVAMMNLSPHSSSERRPDYPVMMRGLRINFDDPWLSLIFDHPFLWFVEEAAVASLRNYSDANSNTTLEGKKLVHSSAADVSKDFFRRVLLDPFNHTYMPKKTAIDLDVGALGSRGANGGVMLRFTSQF